MLTWAIEAATKSGCFERIIVSTDDSEIARVALDSGSVEVLHRSAATASDEATIAEVLLATLPLLSNEERPLEIACCLFATAAFASPEDLREGRALLSSGDFDVVMAIAQYEAPIQRALVADASGRLVQQWPRFSESRTQDLTPAYFDAGQWYWFRTKAVVDGRTMRPSNLGGVLVPSYRVQDIDTPQDWIYAEIKHSIIFPTDDP